ncbi:MAG: alpha/beta hydrolase [Chloroflexi bacterium]|nr:alpha/beta hydrolase [Chloroflexota bacterium]
MARRKVLTGVGVLLALFMAFLVVGTGVYLSNLIRDSGLLPDFEEPEFDLVVADIGDGLITLRLLDGFEDNELFEHAGVLGLKGESSYNRVGDIVSLSSREVQRQFIQVTGPPEIGEPVRLDSFAYEGDPATALGLDFEEIFFTSPVGEFPAWYVEGDRDTWAVIVHGRNANPGEALRVMPILSGTGMKLLAIHYRNDQGLPASEDGLHRYGLTEWEDLEASVRYALDNGADDIVLFGYSMGGGVVANFLYQSTLSDQVSAVILDSPMLELGRTIDWGGQQLGYPQFLLSYAKFAASLRFDVDFPATDYLARAGELDVPILLIHGSEDTTIPFSISDDLAKERPDIVTPFFVEGAGHVLAWNIDPEGYNRAVTDFLAAIAD